jgi:tetratricopeptide (TPR) repeat protein
VVGSSRKELKRRGGASRPRGFPAFRNLVVPFVLGLFAAVAIALISWWVGRPPPASREIGMKVDDLCVKAGNLVKEERHADAYELLLQAARLDPRDARPFMGLGDISRSLDYTELGERFYRKAVEIEPSNKVAKISLSQVLCDLGKSREAIALLEEVERERPGDPFVWAELAVNVLHLGKPREAISLLERYNKTRGRQAWGYENLGRALAEAGDLGKAEEAYRTAIEIEPKTALAHLWLGQLLIRTRRKAEAEAHLRAFREIRDLQTQARLLEQGINRSPDDVQTLARLAHVRALLGQYAAALVPLERAMRLAPGDDRLRQFHASVKAKLEGR